MEKENICKFITSSANEGISVKNFIYERNVQILSKKIRLSENRLYLITKGEGSIFLNENQTVFEEGNLIFAFEGEEVYIKGDCECMYINFEGFRASELFYRFEISFHNRIFDGRGLIPLWQESLMGALENTVDLAAESMLLYSFSRLHISKSKQSNVVTEIIRISEKNFSDTDLSVSKIAQKLDYNPKYISYVFKQKMKISYSEYLRALRIKYAISLFDSGLDSIKNVAFLSGFSDPLYFSTVFKKTVGKSPTEYLKR